MSKRPPDIMQPFKFYYNLAIKPAIRLTRSIPPESEYIAGAIALGTYITCLVAPEILPSSTQQVLQSMRQNIETTSRTAYEAGLISGSTFSLALTVDGARRIALERLPYIKAYFNTFIFNREITSRV